MTLIADRSDAMTVRNATHTVHDGSGRFLRTAEQKRADQRACELRSASLSYAQIGELLGVSRSTACDMVRRGIADVPTERAEQTRALELEKLDRLERRALEVLDTDHVRVEHGRIILHDGKPLVDYRPTLHAIATLVRVAERRAKLLGLDAPARHAVDVITDEVVEAESNRLRAEIADMRAELGDAKADRQDGLAVN
jgi:hypothetical protein